MNEIFSDDLYILHWLKLMNYFFNWVKNKKLSTIFFLLFLEALETEELKTGFSPCKKSTVLVYLAQITSSYQWVKTKEVKKWECAHTLKSVNIPCPFFWCSHQQLTMHTLQNKILPLTSHWVYQIKRLDSTAAW